MMSMLLSLDQGLEVIRYTLNSILRTDLNNKDYVFYLYNLFDNCIVSINNSLKAKEIPIYSQFLVYNFLIGIKNEDFQRA